MNTNCINITSISKENIQKAAALIKKGGLVAFPTETVYGLGANALDGKAVARIFDAKGRPSFNPLIVHVANIKQAKEYAEWNETAEILAHHFWPGPLSIVIDKRQGELLSDLVSAGLPSIALRVPAVEEARQLIEFSDVPIAAPSANLSGKLSPTSPEHVAHSLGNAVDMILAGGSCSVGLESTIIDVTENTPILLRPGAITKEEIEEVLGSAIELYQDNDIIDKNKDEIEHPQNISKASSLAPKAPGMLSKHYAPNIPLRLNAVNILPGEALLAFGSDRFMGIEGGGAAKDLPQEQRCNLSEEGDLHEAAANLFAMLRKLDDEAYKAIAVMNIPEKGLGVAINDRLRRAAAKE